MSFMAWRINKYIYLNLASSIPVGRSMWRRPCNFHDAGRSNQSCMGLNIPNYEASLVSHAQLSPFRWYNRHMLQLDDVEYHIKILIWHLISGRKIETPHEVMKDLHTALLYQEQQVRSQSMMNIHTYIAFNHRRSKKNEGRLSYRDNEVFHDYSYLSTPHFQLIFSSTRILDLTVILLDSETWLLIYNNKASNSNTATFSSTRARLRWIC